MGSEATSARDELLAFRLALDEKVCDEVRREDWGRVFLTPSAALIWDVNRVAIEAVGLSVDQVVAIADDALGGAGFGHRAICLLDQADGGRIGAEVEAEAARRPRWEVERTRYMLWRGGAPEPPATSPPAAAREVNLAQIAGLRQALIGESMPAGGAAEAAVGQLFELDRRYGVAAGDRWFVAPTAGEPMSACRLLRAGGIAQVEEVGTLAPARERGYAKAIVLAAVATARAEGAETVFLTTDAADWPQLLYARLGFEIVGDLTTLRRRP